MTLRIHAALAAVLLLSACGGGGPAADRYVLNNDFSSIAHGHARSGTLKIVLPVAAPGLDSTQVAVQQKNGQLNFASGREWADALPKLVQAQLVEAFEASNLYSSVVPDSQGVTSRASLMTDIRDFTYDEPGAQVKVRLVARIVNPASRTVEFSVSSKQTVTVEGNGVMGAFSEASNKAASEIVKKISRKLR